MSEIETEIQKIFIKFEKDINGLQGNLPKEITDLLKNKSTTAEALDNLAINNSHAATYGVAKHKNCSKETLEKIYKSKFYCGESVIASVILSRVANNKNTKKSTLVSLSKLDVSSEYYAPIVIKVAENENASEITLKRLSKSKNGIVKLAVLANKNTPKDVLINLCYDSDEYICKQALEAIFNILNETYEYDNAIAINNKTPPVILKKLAGSDTLFTRFAVAENPNTSKETLKYLSKDIDGGISKMAKKALRKKEKNNSADKDIHIDLAKAKEEVNKVELAKTSTNPEELNDLSKDGDFYVDRAVAENINTSKETLEYLSKNIYDEIRCNVAKNKNTSKETLNYLLSDIVNDVVVAAENALTTRKNTNTIVLPKNNTDKFVEDLQLAYSSKDQYKLFDLSNYTNKEIRAIVAENTNTSEDVLHRLSNDICEIVRYNVALNKNIAKKTLAKMLEDDNPGVKRAAEIRSLTSFEKALLAATSTDQQDLYILSKTHDNWEARRNVAKNNNTPLDVIVSLSKDNMNIVSDAAKNKLKVLEAINEQTTIELLKDRDIKPVKKTKFNDNILNKEDKAGSPYKYKDISFLSVEEKLKFAETSTDVDIIYALSNDNERLVRCKVGLNPNTPEDIMDCISRDADWNVRRHLIFNKNVPVKILNTLVEDKYSMISDAAKEILKKFELAKTSLDFEELKELTNHNFNIVSHTAKRSFDLIYNSFNNKSIEPISQKLKSNANSALYRIASKQITNATKGLILSIFEKYSNSSNIDLLKSMVNTDTSDAILSFLLGFGILYIPKFKDDERVKVIAKELRVEGIATGGNIAFDSIINELIPMLMTEVRVIPEEVVEYEESVEEHQEQNKLYL